MIKDINELLKNVKFLKELSTLPERMTALEEENKALRTMIEKMGDHTDGEPCPKCRMKTLTLSDTKPHPYMPEISKMFIYTCSNPDCRFTTEKEHFG